jgi:phospholipid N-methyltransferase
MEKSSLLSLSNRYRTVIDIVIDTLPILSITVKVNFCFVPSTSGQPNNSGQLLYFTYPFPTTTEFTVYLLINMTYGNYLFIFYIF